MSSKMRHVHTRMHQQYLHEQDRSLPSCVLQWMAWYSNYTFLNLQKLSFEWKSIRRKTRVPVSHISPVKPAAQSQTYVLKPISSRHVPSFKHGLLSHSSISVKIQKYQYVNFILNVSLKLFYTSSLRRIFSY